MITPWDVTGEIDYTKLIKEFGTHEITQDLKQQIQRAVGELHFLIKRNFFFSHRDLDKILNDYLSGKGFFLYTGRGPSGPMHIGHLPSYILTKWFQDKFNVNVYIQFSDDEKYLIKHMSFREIDHFTYENILDIIALGFDPDKTFIFRNTEYIKHMYKRSLEIGRKITFSSAKAVFGFNNSTNISLINYPALQMVPTFFEKKRALIPAGIDQDPYWRLQRDVAESLGYYKTAAIHSIFLPPLSGFNGKMSTTEQTNAIMLTDDEKTVKKKIMKYAFSGGQPTIEEHRKKGGNPYIDVSYLYLYYLFESDDNKIKKIEEDYKSGILLTGELKQILVDKINDFLYQFNQKRERAKDKIDKFLYNGTLAQKMWNI